MGARVLPDAGRRRIPGTGSGPRRDPVTGSILVPENHSLGTDATRAIQANLDQNTRSQATACRRVGMALSRVGASVDAPARPWPCSRTSGWDGRDQGGRRHRARCDKDPVQGLACVRGASRLRSSPRGPWAVHPGRGLFDQGPGRRQAVADRTRDRRPALEVSRWTGRLLRRRGRRRPAGLGSAVVRELARRPVAGGSSRRTRHEYNEVNLASPASVGGWEWTRSDSCKNCNGVISPLGTVVFDPSFLDLRRRYSVTPGVEANYYGQARGEPCLGTLPSRHLRF